MCLRCHGTHSLLTPEEHQARDEILKLRAAAMKKVCVWRGGGALCVVCSSSQPVLFVCGVYVCAYSINVLYSIYIHSNMLYIGGGAYTMYVSMQLPSVCGWLCCVVGRGRIGC